MIKTQMEMYLHEELETLTRTEIEALQFERLLRTVRRCMKSPFYQKRFAEAHLSPEDIRSLDDLRKIPFTTKQDLRDNYPFGLAAVPMSEVVRLHSSSGTTGTPTVILHTQKDFKYCFFIQVLFDWFFFPVKGTKNFAFDSHED